MRSPSSPSALGSCHRLIFSSEVLNLVTPHSLLWLCYITHSSKVCSVTASVRITSSIKSPDNLSRRPMITEHWPWASHYTRKVVPGDRRTDRLQGWGIQRKHTGRSVRHFGERSSRSRCVYGILRSLWALACLTGRLPCLKCPHSREHRDLSTDHRAFGGFRGKSSERVIITPHELEK